MMYIYKYNQTKEFANNLLLVKNFSQTSSVFSSNTSNFNIEALLRGSEHQERLNNLKLIKYQKEPTNIQEELTDLGITNYSESFPWFIDSDGKLLDFNKPIKLFEGVQLISKYLEHKLNTESIQISESKINEIRCDAALN